MADIEKLVGDESRLELGQKINDIIDNSANVSLSNLDEIGEARFSDLAAEISTNAVNISKKANTTDIDGKWTAKELVLINNVKLANSGTITYSLANYLPSDNNIYEVMISFAGYFDQGQYSFNTSFYTVHGPYGKNRQVSGSITTPVGTAKELRLYPTSFCSGDNELTIRINAYRKVR